MALVQISQTQWHGNPRPVTSYCTTVYDDAVTPIQYSYIISSAPLSTLAPAGSIVTPGPALEVVADLDGLWPNGTQLSVAITVTGGTDIVDTITQTAQATLLPEDAAVRVSNYLNANYGTEITAAHTGDGNVTITALSPVTGLTITTWAVV